MLCLVKLNFPPQRQRNSLSCLGLPLQHIPVEVLTHGGTPQGLPWLKRNGHSLLTPVANLSHLRPFGRPSSQVFLSLLYFEGLMVTRHKKSGVWGHASCLVSKIWAHVAFSAASWLHPQVPCGTDPFPCKPLVELLTSRRL